MNEITLLRDYDPRHGYQSWLILFSDQDMGREGRWLRRGKRVRRRIQAIERLRSTFIERFGYAPQATRLLNKYVIAAGPIGESEKEKENV